MQSLPDNQISRGLRVFLVGNFDTFTLKVIEILCSKFDYHVTKCVEPVNAMKLLGEKKDSFDIIMMDHPFEDMEVIQLINFVKSSNLNIPVILISHDERQRTALRGLQSGACAYYVRPISYETMKNIWQFVHRESKMVNNGNSAVKIENKLNSKDQNNEQGSDENHKDAPEATPVDETTEQGVTIVRAENQLQSVEGGGEIKNNPPLKKRRVVWSDDLHRRFLSVIDQLGLENAVPKKIKEFMNVSYLTRENVASHLQKYRDYLKKQNENGVGNNHKKPPPSGDKRGRPPQICQVQRQYQVPVDIYNNYSIPLNSYSSQRLHLHPQPLNQCQHPNPPPQVQHQSHPTNYQNNPLLHHSNQNIPQHSLVMEHVLNTWLHDPNSTLASSKNGLVQNPYFNTMLLNGLYPQQPQIFQPSFGGIINNASINNNHYYHQLQNSAIPGGINELGGTNTISDFSTLDLADHQFTVNYELDNMDLPDNPEVDTNIDSVQQFKP